MRHKDECDAIGNQVEMMVFVESETIKERYVELVEGRAILTRYFGVCTAREARDAESADNVGGRRDSFVLSRERRFTAVSQTSGGRQGSRG